MSQPTLKLTKEISTLCKRNLGVFAPAWQKGGDPIQQLFIQKIRDYKSKSAGGKLVEPSPELEKQLKSEKERALRQYNVKPGDDLTKFPTFNFPDPQYQPTGVEQTQNIS